MIAATQRKPSCVAGPGWGWVCNEVCDGYVNEVCNEAKQSAVRKERLRSTKLFNTSQAAAKRGVAGQNRRVGSATSYVTATRRGLYRGKAKRSTQSAALFNASQAAAKSRVVGPGWGWVCKKVCNGYVTRSVTRQSTVRKAPPQLQLDCSYSTKAKLRQKKRAVTSLARFVHLKCVTRVCNEGV